MTETMTTQNTSGVTCDHPDCTQPATSVWRGNARCPDHLTDEMRQITKDISPVAG